MIGTIGLIGLMTSLAGTIAGGVGSAYANKANDRYLKDSLAQSYSEANKELYGNPLARRDNALYLRNLREQLKNQRASADAKGRILGTTQEMNTALQGSQADAYSDAISKLAAVNSSRRDSILNRLQQNRLSNEGAQMNLRLARMKNWETLAKNATTMGGKLMGSLAGDITGTGVSAPSAVAPSATSNNSVIDDGIDSSVGKSGNGYMNGIDNDEGYM